jgi:uridine kinase
MTNFVLGIAGGSGAGKSTLAFGLEDKWPKDTLVFHLDDYFKPEDDVPKVRNLTNWDSPEALYSEKMARDLQLLKTGVSAVINTKSPRLNPDFLQTGKRIPVEFKPKPLIVVEGFLSFHFEALRRLMDLSVYLDAPYELHSSRRIHGKLHKFPPEYDEYILRPMHEQYVAPSKQYADVVMDVAVLTKNQALQKMVELVIERTDLEQ